MTPTILQHARKARETALFALLADLGAIRVTGADAASFLHSQLTNEVNALKPGEGNLSARVTRTGTLVRYCSLHRLPEPPGGFMLLLERDGVAPLQQDLEKFAIADDVAFEDVSDQYDWLAVQGPLAAELAQNAWGAFGAESWADIPESAVRTLDVWSEGVPRPPTSVPSGGTELPGEGGRGTPALHTLVFNRSLTGDTGFIIAAPGGQTKMSAPLLRKLAGVAMHKGAIHLEGADLAEVLDILRVEAGIVRIGPDAEQGKRVLPETGMENQVVSYSKGCYLGQEIIARIRTYGSVPNVLRGLVFSVDPGPRTPDSGPVLPAPGADVVLEDGRKVGQFASRTFSPVLEALVAFAYLDREHRTPGTMLKIKCLDGSAATARVQLLPFYKASDLKSRVSFLHDRAIRLFAEEKDEKAIQMLEEALRLDPSFSDGYEALGVILGRSGKFQDAIEIFKRLEEVAPNEPMVHTNLSLYYMKLGDKTKAEEEKAKATVKQFSRFGSMKRDEQKAAEELAAKRADAQRKKAMFEEVLEIDAEDPIALFGLGNALSALEMWDAAEKTLAKATAAQKDNSAVYLAHGKVLEMLNREADAVAVYKAGMAVASKKGDLMPLKEMERRVLLLAK